MATMNDSTIALYCEMRAFIRPDSFLIWEGPGGQRINGTDKYQIIFSNGSPNVAANGGGVLVPSRVSTLTITNPEPSDAGTYTCSVNGTDQAVAIELVVNGVSTPGTTGTADTTNTSSSPSTLPTSIVVISLTAVIFGILTIAALTTVTIFCYLKYAKDNSQRIPNDSDINPMYDYPDSVYHHGVQPDDCELRTANRKDGSIGRSGADAVANSDINTMEKAVITDTNVAYGVVNDGMNASMETNMAYGVADTILEENEAYGAAIDGIGIDTMERNIAYGAVMTVHDDTAGDGIVESDDENIYY